MRKRDFEAIAGAIKAARDSACPSDASAALAFGDAMDSMARAIADTLARQSGRFNRLRFLNGCGVSAENIKKDLTRFGVVLI